MGMFDSFYFLSGIGPKCAAGHVPPGEFQTKSLDCTLGQYFVDETGQIWFADKDLGERVDIKKREYSFHRELVPAEEVSGPVHIYGECTRCEGVYVKRKKLELQDLHLLEIEVHYPRVEGALETKEGRVTGFTPKIVEEATVLAKKYRAAGKTVLAKTDRRVLGFREREKQSPKLVDNSQL